MRSETKVLIVLTFAVGLLAGTGEFLIGTDYCVGCNGHVAVISFIGSPLLGAGVTATPNSTGTASLVFALTGVSSYITSLSMWPGGGPSTEGGNLTRLTLSSSITGVTITSWQIKPDSKEAITFSNDSAANSIAANGVTNFYYYPRTDLPVNIALGEYWSFVIYFANGQSVGAYAAAQ